MIEVEEQLRRYFAHIDARVDATTAGHADGGSEAVRSETAGNRPQWRSVTLGAAAVLIAIVVGLVLVSRDGDDESPAPADTPATRPVATLPPVPGLVEIAEQAVAALTMFDVESVEAMLAEDASVIYWESDRAPGGLAGSVGYTEVTGFRLTEPQCTQVDEVRVECTVRQQNAWSDATGHEGVEGRFEFDVVNGGIERLFYMVDGKEWGASAFLPFVHFVQDRHPDGVARLWEPASYRSITTPEALEYWRQYSEEFAAG